MLIDCPWPPKELNPNFKRTNHWTRYRPKEKQARVDGYHCALEAIQAQGGIKLPKQGIVWLRVKFTPPDRRNRDDDNMIGSFKNYRDGIADALAVDDVRFRCEYTFAAPSKPGGVQVEVLADKPF